MTASAVPTPANVRALIAKPTHSYVHVTPDIAARWLALNSINRTIRRARVNQYARDMAEGRWSLSNDDLCFDTEGLLLNGQHRLHAIVQSGATVVLGVKRNVPREAMANMDTPACRSAADALGFAHDEKYAALTAATAKQMILLESGRIYQDTKQQAVSHGEIIGWVEERPQVRSSVLKASNVRKAVDAPPTALAVAHLLIAERNDVDVADLFLDRLAEPVSEPEGSAIFAIRLRQREIQRHRQSFATRNHVYLLVKGWNYYAAGTPVTRLQVTPKSGTPFRIPAAARWSRP